MYNILFFKDYHPGDEYLPDTDVSKIGHSFLQKNQRWWWRGLVQEDSEVLNMKANSFGQNLEKGFL